MKQPAFLSERSLFAKLCPLFAGLTWLLAMLLYIAAAINLPTIGILLALSVAFTALFLWKGEQSKACRMIGRIGLLAPTALMLVIFIVYFVVLLAEGYGVTAELCLMITLLVETALLFTGPCFALLALRGRKPDVILNRACGIANLILACFTVFYVTTLKTVSGGPLLITWIQSPVFSALFLISAAAAVATSFEGLYKKDKTPSRRGER